MAKLPSQLLPETWNVVVKVDSRFYRPLEVDSLTGDAGKAKALLGWTPEYDINELVRICLVQTKTIKDLLSIKFPNNLLALVGEDLLNRQKNLTEIKGHWSILTECEQQGAQAKTAGSNRRADWGYGWSGASVYYGDRRVYVLPCCFKKNTHIKLETKYFKTTMVLQKWTCCALTTTYSLQKASFPKVPQH